jgi:hypothetical protein
MEAITHLHQQRGFGGIGVHKIGLILRQKTVRLRETTRATLLAHSTRQGQEEERYHDGS